MMYDRQGDPLENLLAGHPSELQDHLIEQQEQLQILQETNFGFSFPFFWFTSFRHLSRNCLGEEQLAEMQQDRDKKNQTP